MKGWWKVKHKNQKIHLDYVHQVIYNESNLNDHWKHKHQEVFLDTEYDNQGDIL